MTCLLLEHIERYQKERKKTDNPREGWEDGTPPPHRDLSATSKARLKPKVIPVKSRKSVFYKSYEELLPPGTWLVVASARR